MLFLVPQSRRATLRLPLPNDFMDLRLTSLVRSLSFGSLTPLTSLFRASMSILLPETWKSDPVHGSAQPVLLLAAGPGNRGLPFAAGEQGWPSAAREMLRLHARLSGAGAPFACFVETREDPARPETAKARSPVLVGYVR